MGEKYVYVLVYVNLSPGTRTLFLVLFCCGHTLVGRLFPCLFNSSATKSLLTSHFPPDEHELGSVGALFSLYVLYTCMQFFTEEK